MLLREEGSCSAGHGQAQSGTPSGERSRRERRELEIPPRRRLVSEAASGRATVAVVAPTSENVRAHSHPLGDLVTFGPISSKSQLFQPSSCVGFGQTFG